MQLQSETLLQTTLLGDFCTENFKKKKSFFIGVEKYGIFKNGIHIFQSIIFPALCVNLTYIFIFSAQTTKLKMFRRGLSFKGCYYCVIVDCGQLEAWQQCSKIGSMLSYLEPHTIWTLPGETNRHGQVIPSFSPTSIIHGQNKKIWKRHAGKTPARNIPNIFWYN